MIETLSVDGRTATYEARREGAGWAWTLQLEGAGRYANISSAEPAATEDAARQDAVAAVRRELPTLAMRLWADRFTTAYAAAVEGECDTLDLMDWAYEVYATESQREPEEVAAAEVAACHAIYGKP